MPVIHPATYPAQQAQSQLPMATKTIARTLMQTTTQPDIAQQFSQPPEEPLGGTGGPGEPVPPRSNQLNSEEAQVQATLINAFRRCLRRQRGRDTGGGDPPDDDNLGDGGSEPSNDEPDGAGLQDHVPIPQARDIKPIGSLPQIFDGDRARADTFLTEYLGYLMLNQGVPGFESPIRQVAMALTLIKGEKVDLWVKNMLDSLRRLHPVQHNVPAVWNHFEKAFRAKFTDSTRELRARSQLERLKFRYPDIDSYIAEFEDLIVQAGYNIATQETINLFLKGFNRNRNLLDKVFTPPVL